MSEAQEKRPGPEPDRLKLPHEDWEEAVREALEEEKPERVSQDAETENSEPEDN